jgi:hypothetical protein
MKFIYLTGGPCTAKTSIVENIENTMGEYVEYSPIKLFKGKLYKKTNTFVMHLDSTSYGVIPKFKEFVNLMHDKEISVLAEGDRWTTAKYIEWLLNTYSNSSKVFLLTVSDKVEELRHKQRGDKQSLVWRQGRRKVTTNLQNNLFLRNQLTIRDTSDTIDEIQKEIMELL